MTIRDRLIEKLSDGMDQNNAAEFVDAAIAEQTAAWRVALLKIRGHTSYSNPTFELLQGLLQSIERIADAALYGRDFTPGCDCDQANNPDVRAHASDCDWRKAVEKP